MELYTGMEMEKPLGGVKEIQVEENTEEIIQRMATVRNEVIKRFQAEFEEKVGNRMDSIIEFYKKIPPVFQGENDLDVAEYWMDEINEILVVIELTDDATRILLATSQLRGLAESWWTGVKEAQGLTGMRWETFVDLFKYKFYP